MSEKNTKIGEPISKEELIKSPEFWTEYIRTELYEVVESYMSENKLNRTQLAHKLGVHKSYISQILNGESDHRISKLVDLSTRLGKAPYIYFKDMQQVLNDMEVNRSPYLDFKTLERKAIKCDLLNKAFSLSTKTNSNIPVQRASCENAMAKVTLYQEVMKDSIVRSKRKSFTTLFYSGKPSYCNG